MQNLRPDVQDMFAARRHPLRAILHSHSDANMRWRYLHEESYGAQFETGEIDRALTVIIDAYEKRISNGDF